MITQLDPDLLKLIVDYTDHFRGMDFPEENYNRGGRRGGYLCIANQQGVVLAILMIGKVSEDRAHTVLLRALENVKQFIEYHGCQMSPGDFPMTTSHDDEWPGAVRGQNYIASTAGFFPLYNKRISVAFLFRIGDWIIPGIRKDSVFTREFIFQEEVIVGAVARLPGT